MNVVYIILLFIAPGLILKAIREYITVTGSKSSKGTVYEQLFNVVAHSVVISCLVLAIINVIYAILGFKLIISIDTLFIKLNNMGFMLFYIVVVLASTSLWTYLFYKYINKKMIEMANKLTSKKLGTKIKTEEQRTVLQDILYIDTSTLDNPEERLPMIVSIFKEGKLITTGELREWNCGLEDPIEWRLFFTYELNKVMEADKNRNDEEKWLNYVEYEYYDIEHDLLVKFYDPTTLIEHWHEL